MSTKSPLVLFLRALSESVSYWSTNSFIISTDSLFFTL